MQYGGIIIFIILAFIGTIVVTAQLIPLINHKRMGQNIRSEGPKSHMSKAGTPSMGGIGIVIVTILISFLGGYINSKMLAIVICFVGFAGIGFWDDYLKVIKKQNEGLKAWQKFSLLFIVAGGFAIYAYAFSGLGTEVYIPFVKVNVDFGIWYVPFIIFTILAMTNAVNLTDGLDGLAAGVTVIVSIFMCHKAYELGVFSSVEFFAALSGSCLGFLVFNKHPAKIFMGDTGSLAIGGGLAAAAIVMKMEFLLALAGFVFVLEAASVILQVVFFKATGGKRLFRMAPLHHHFEEGGMKEVSVVIGFWLLTFIFTAAAKLWG